MLRFSGLCFVEDPAAAAAAAEAGEDGNATWTWLGELSKGFLSHVPPVEFLYVLRAPAAQACT